MDRIFKFKDSVIKPYDKMILCGILNVTPDSFSDGGKWNNEKIAVKHALDMINQGAGMIDIGGESTRPGSHYVEIEEEIKRVVPVIKRIKEVSDITISVDTWKAEVAREAIKAGADIINDITGFLGDPDMAKVVGESNVGAILMFNPVLYRPEHPSTKVFPSFGGEDAFTEIEKENMKSMPIEEAMKFYLERSLEIAEKYGVLKDRIMLDPGIGFGLTKKENLTLIKKMDILHEMGCEIFLGVSRKRFIVNMLKEDGFNSDSQTDEGIKNIDLSSSYLTAIASIKNVEVVRVHSIPEHRMAALIADNIRFAELAENTNFGAYKN